MAPPHGGKIREKLSLRKKENQLIHLSLNLQRERWIIDQVALSSDFLAFFSALDFSSSFSLISLEASSDFGRGGSALFWLCDIQFTDDRNICLGG